MIVQMNLISLSISNIRSHSSDIKPSMNDFDFFILIYDHSRKVTILWIIL